MLFRRMDFPSGSHRAARLRRDVQSPDAFPGRWLLRKTLSWREAGRLHFEHGQGSLWTRAWVRGTAGGEDAGDRGGRGDGGESVGQRRGPGCEYRSSAGWGDRGRTGRHGADGEADGSSWHGPQEGGQKGGPGGRPGARGQEGVRAREPALRRGGLEALCAALRSVVAGGLGGVFWDLRAAGLWIYMEVPRSMARECGEHGGPSQPGGRGRDAGAVRLLLREQLCAGAAAGTWAVARKRGGTNAEGVARENVPALERQPLDWEQ